MGTGFEVDACPEAAGIIPRAVDHLFRGIHERQEAARRAGQPPADFKISAQFMELYNEEVIDLLDQSGANRVSSPRDVRSLCLIRGRVTKVTRGSCDLLRMQLVTAYTAFTVRSQKVSWIL